MIYLLDTDHITLMDRGGQEGQNILARLAALPTDQVIASVIANNVTLLSHNLSDFSKVPGLIVEDWSVEQQDE